MQKNNLLHLFILDINSVLETNNINFHYRRNSVKINDQIFHKFFIKVLAHFWLIFSFFWPKSVFQKDLVLSHTTLFGFLVQF